MLASALVQSWLCTISSYSKAVVWRRRRASVRQSASVIETRLIVTGKRPDLNTDCHAFLGESGRLLSSGRREIGDRARLDAGRSDEFDEIVARRERI